MFPRGELRESIRWWHCERVERKQTQRGAWAQAFRTGSDPGADVLAITVFGILCSRLNSSRGCGIMGMIPRVNSFLLRFCTVSQLYQEPTERSHGRRVKVDPKAKFSIELPGFMDKKLSLGSRTDFERYCTGQAGYFG
jgi:hypothetical protein